MPELLETDIKTAITLGEVRLFSIDTNIFDGYKNGLEFGLLKTLHQFKGQGVKFCLSEVVYKELQTHMIKACEESHRAFITVLKSAKGSWAIGQTEIDIATNVLFNKQAAHDRTNERLEAFKKATDLTVIPAQGYVDVGSLIESYFSPKPPFEAKTDKKNEFPDAIALMSLEGEAQKRSTKMLVVSNDKGWAKYCALSPHLICVNHLGTALSLLQELPSIIATQLAERFVSNLLPNLKTAIEDELKNYIESSIAFAEAESAYFYDYDTVEASFSGFNHALEPDFRVVDHDPSDNTYYIELSIDVDIEASCDFTLYLTDDGDDIVVGNTSATSKSTENISIMIVVEGDIKRDFEVHSVEVISGPSSFNFGYISLDHSDYHDY